MWESYLIYAGVAAGGWLLRHYNIGTSFGNNLLSMLNLQPAAPAVPVVASALPAVVAPSPVSDSHPVLSAVEQDLLQLLLNAKSSLEAKAQADLASMVTQALQPASPVATPPAPGVAK